MDNIFNAGEIVPRSGLYRMTHYPPHKGEEDMALEKGNSFPACGKCLRGSFMLLYELQGALASKNARDGEKPT